MPQDHERDAPRVRPRRRDGGLVGLRAAVREERLFQVARRYRRQLFRQVGLRLIRVQRGRVGQRLDLLDDGFRHLRIGMPDGDGQDPAERVEIAVARIVPDVRALAPREGDRFLVVHRDGGEEVFLVLADDVGCAHRYAPWCPERE